MMDLQTMLNNMSIASRRESLSKSDQLTLGELLLKLEAIPESNSQNVVDGVKTPYPRRVVFEFEGLSPTSFHSWRGSYSEIALGFQLDGTKMLKDFIEEVKKAIGSTYEGYKGGDFLMDKHTPVWVENYGDGVHNGIVDVMYDDYEVVLITKRCSY